METEMCVCGEMPKSKCPGEWEPGCDLGNNEAHVVVGQLTPEELEAIKKAISPA